MRIGQGFDVHALVPGRRLVIGGVEIPHDKGLAGHSDADVLIHAICDSLLGAAGLGDIGRHFPDTDPRYRGGMPDGADWILVQQADDRTAIAAAVACVPRPDADRKREWMGIATVSQAAARVSRGRGEMPGCAPKAAPES